MSQGAEVMRPPAMMDLEQLRRERARGAVNGGQNPFATLVAPPTNPVVRQALREDLMDNSAAVDVPGAAPGAPGSSVHDHDGWRGKLAHICGEFIKDESMDKATVKQKLLAAAKMIDDEGGGDKPAEEPAAAEPPAAAAEPPPEEEPEPEPEMEESIKSLLTSGDPKQKELYESLVATRKQQIKTQRALDKAKSLGAYKDRQAQAKKMCMESKLKDLYKGEIPVAFLEEVAQAKDEKGMKRLIENTVAIVSVRKPTSLPGHLGGGVNGGNEPDAKKFAEFLTALPPRR